MIKVIVGLLACLSCACFNLDTMVFAAKQAPATANLMAKASAIPEALKTEILQDIVTVDGIHVSAWLLTHNASDNTPLQRHQTAILYCHGNNSNIENYAQRVQALWQLGYTVLIFDYRGFGKTPGTPYESSTYNDARAAWAYFKNRSDLGLNAQRIAIYGYSLGTGVCSQIAIEQQAPVLILEAPFTSITALFQDSATLDMPLSWVADAHYATVEKIPFYRGSLLLMHGTNDTHIQPKYSQEIAKAAIRAHPLTLWFVPDAGHLTVPCVIVDPDHPTTDCTGGFSETYLDKVSRAIDHAIATTP